MTSSDENDERTHMAAHAPRTIAVVLCAGQGTRMGAAQNKVLLPLAGKPVLVHTLEAFERARGVDEVLLVAHPREVAYCERAIVRRHALAKVAGVVAGGATRHQSERCALEALRDRIAAGAITTILIHDGARPLVSDGEIERVLAAAHAVGGAVLVAPFAAAEIVLEVAEDGAVRGIVPSADLARAQTPQAFAARALLAAYDAAAAVGFEGTDTAAALERLGLPVAAVPGSADNLKITTPDDLIRGAALLAQ